VYGEQKMVWYHAQGMHQRFKNDCMSVDNILPKWITYNIAEQIECEKDGREWYAVFMIRCLKLAEKFKFWLTVATPFL
jgi:hypothetical protein